MPVREMYCWFMGHLLVFKKPPGLSRQTNVGGSCARVGEAVKLKERTGIPEGLPRTAIIELLRRYREGQRHGGAYPEFLFQVAKPGRP